MKTLRSIIIIPLCFQWLSPEAVAASITATSGRNGQEAASLLLSAQTMTLPAVWDRLPDFRISSRIIRLVTASAVLAGALFFAQMSAANRDAHHAAGSHSTAQRLSAMIERLNGQVYSNANPVEEEGARQNSLQLLRNISDPAAAQALLAIVIEVDMRRLNGSPLESEAQTRAQEIPLSYLHQRGLSRAWLLSWHEHFLCVQYPSDPQTDQGKARRVYIEALRVGIDALPEEKIPAWHTQTLIGLAVLVIAGIVSWFQRIRNRGSKINDWLDSGTSRGSLMLMLAAGLWALDAAGFNVAAGPITLAAVPLMPRLKAHRSSRLTDEAPDQILIGTLLEGLGDDFNRLWTALFKTLRALFPSISKEDIEDALQHTLTYMIEAQISIRDPDKLELYLLNSAKRKVLDRIRFRGAHPQFPLDEIPSHEIPTPALQHSTLEKEEHLALLNQAITSLPKNQKTAILLYRQGIPEKVIGEIVNASRMAVKMRKHHAVQNLIEAVRLLMSDPSGQPAVASLAAA